MCSVRTTKNYIRNCSFFCAFIQFSYISERFRSFGSSEKSLQKRSGSDSISYWVNLNLFWRTLKLTEVTISLLIWNFLKQPRHLFCHLIFSTRIFEKFESMVYQTNAILSF
jgi:hypothetical protein